MSSPVNLWLLGLFNNIAGSGSYIGNSCQAGNNLPGLCTPLYGCPYALRELGQYRQPVYCSSNAFLTTVCCPNRDNYKERPDYPPVFQYPIPPDRSTESSPTIQFPPDETPPIIELPSTVTTITTEKPIDAEDTTPRSNDHIVFHRLAERKCKEYGSDEYIYENKTTFDYYGNPVVTYDPCPGLFQIGPAVVGGLHASPKEYPHMALVGYGSDEPTARWLCGGTIISLRFVLTAAHCINTARGSPTFVRIGDLDHSASTDDAAPQTIPVHRSIAHEGYRPPYVYNDIGLLELVNKILISAYGRPACLATDDILPTEIVIATGWGKTEFTGQSSPVLMEVDLEQFSTGDCANTYKASVQLPAGLDGDSQLCAGSRHEEKDTCSGDSGGPLQVLHNEHRCMYKIIGVTSFGRGCGNIGVPGVYTRVSYFIDWIEERAFAFG